MRRLSLRRQAWGESACGAAGMVQGRVKAEKLQQLRWCLQKSQLCRASQQQTAL